jgi:fatty aldehyde-generating acyl-ACP reductase
VSYLAAEPPWFAFVVHPRDLADFLTMPGGSLLRRYSDDDEDYVRKASTGPPVVLDDVTFSGASIRGELIGVPKLPEAIATPDGSRAVAAAVDLAIERGARVIGLGALTAPATAGGRSLLKRLPPGVTLTNGNGLTAAVVRRNVLEAAGALGTAARVALLGATGSVGDALARLLVDDGFEPLLVGPAEDRVRRQFEDVLDRVEVGAGLACLGDADVVVALTSAPDALLTPAAVAPGACVVDVAQPRNVPEAGREAFEASGVRVVRGGSVRIPGYSCGRDFALASARDSFACLAETYLLAREGLREHSVGRPAPAWARRIERIAERHGVVPCPLGLEARRELPQLQPTEV